MKKRNLKNFPHRRNFKQGKMARAYTPNVKPVLLLLLLFFARGLVYGQVDLESGIGALEDAATGIEGYFAPIETIVYIVAGIISLVGAAQVFAKWQKGDADVISRAVGWFGSALFLIVAITVIKSFFDIG